LNVDSGTTKEDVAREKGDHHPFDFLPYATPRLICPMGATDHLAQEASPRKVVQRGERLDRQNVLPAPPALAVGLGVALPRDLFEKASDG
jgi:hypothetical protein